MKHDHASGAAFIGTLYIVREKGREWSVIEMLQHLKSPGSGKSWSERLPLCSLSHITIEDISVVDTQICLFNA